MVAAGEGGGGRHTPRRRELGVSLESTVRSSFVCYICLVCSKFYFSVLASNKNSNSLDDDGTLLRVAETFGSYFKVKWRTSSTFESSDQEVLLKECALAPAIGILGGQEF